jgi:pilus assembly protein TadC
MYEEMIVMVNEMSAGAGERAAYEAFGQRMDNMSYTKLISLLVQNLQKGNDGLLSALKAEESNAFFLRIDQAKKLAEEAGTKLLFPMLLMLVIVMVIVMAPALFQFSGI